MISTRLRSPLRWLWTIIGTLTVVAAAGLTGYFWLLPAVIVVWIVFLMAPPIWVFKHDETPATKTGLHLEIEFLDSDSGAADYLLSVVNNGDEEARDFSIRMLLSHDLAPPGHTVQPIKRIIVGRIGSHWFIETISNEIALTFRAGGLGESPVTVDPGTRVPIAELQFASGRVLAARSLDFQVSGGTVQTLLGSLDIPFSENAGGIESSNA